ncbi:MAG TPA: metalloregulator ArsR/SmtB family transcription factor, partial [Candidatus Paceibacterota bacterium]|nr:metalloregulator ArsR/SmtB family transcription factor [Candidatus Paceibacterota bacterium]
CFKVVGSESRYRLVCYLGKHKEGAGVGELVDFMKLRQPTVTHHLTILKSIDAVRVEERGKERIYRLNPDAHCFEECKIPY